MKSPQQHTLMDNDSHIAETIVYLYTLSSNNHLISMGW